MNEQTAAVLRAPEGLADIAAAADALESGSDELALISRLRARYDAELAREILTQARLRPKARAKFGRLADRMLLIAESLEQASRAEVAARRARRLSALGITELTDAGAGIGADSLAYAAAGLRVRAVELNPDVAAALRANADAARVRDEGAAHTGGSIEVIEGDALASLPADGVVYFDPARRADGRRIFDPELCSPPLSALVAAHEGGLTVVAKMSPSLNVADVPAGWDADWVSTQTEQGRSVVEATLWSPPYGTGARRAIVLHGDAEHVLESARAPAADVGGLDRYVYEPDGAVNQAEVVDDLAQELQAHLLEPRIGYLTSDVAIDTPFAHRYDVLDSLPWSKRAVGRALASHDASDLVVKKRGISVDPTALRKELLPRLRSREGEPLVLILTPHAGGRLAILARAAR